jgi:hypothetical protein
MKVPGWKKAVVFFCCLCGILAVLGSAGFVFFHLAHECTGSECLACAQLQETVNFLRFLGTFPVSVLSAAVLKRAAGYMLGRINVASPPVTGITLKVRFNI